MNIAINVGQRQPHWLIILQQQIESLQYGVVQVLVHDSRVVQIERTEKMRFDKSQVDSAANATAFPKLGTRDTGYSAP